MRYQRATFSLWLTPMAVGAANIFSFAPFGLWPIEIATLAWLFYKIDKPGTNNSVVIFSFTFGWFASGVHWLYIALHSFANIPVLIATLAVIFFAMYMALLSALVFFVFERTLFFTSPRPVVMLLVLPVCWCAAEWTRARLFTGFPWLAAGYAHDSSFLSSFAPIFGVHGISMLVTIIAGGIVLCISTESRKTGLIVIVGIFLLGKLFHEIEWTRPHGDPISVRLLQGGIAQEKKFDGKEEAFILERYRSMIFSGRADLIALPETALTRPINHLPPQYVKSLDIYSKATGSHLLMGMPLLDYDQNYTNSLYGISPNNSFFRYDKYHLVPFGEFIPQPFSSFGQELKIPLGDLKSGPLLQNDFRIKDQIIMTCICYEDVFGSEIAHRMRRSLKVPTILFNSSNLAWFGKSIAVDQHLQISQMRALESGRPVILSPNTGVTALIDAYGLVKNSINGNGPGVLAVSVQGRDGYTPYILFGDYPFMIILVLITVYVALLRGTNTKSCQLGMLETSTHCQAEDPSQTYK